MNMRRIGISGWLALALAVMAAAAAAQAPALNLPAGTRLKAELNTTLDSSTARVGEPVKAKTTANLKLNGQTILPKGTQLLGQVTVVIPAESNRSPSRLGVRFNQAVLKKAKQTVPLSAAIINVEMTSPAMASADMPMNMPSMSPPGAPGATADAGARVRPELGAQGVPGQVTGQNQEIGSMAQASHAQTIRILKPTPSEGSVLTAAQGNLKLQSGTHIDLIVLPAAHQ